MKNKNKQFKTNKYTLVGVMAQLFVTIIVVIIGIIGLIKGGLILEITKIMLGIDFLIMSYNNKWVYNRKNLTIVYIAVGVLFIILGIYGIFR